MKKNWLVGAIPGLAGQARRSPSEDKLSIDYPQAGEKVLAGHYAVRISGCQSECQVAIDDGDWQACRSSDGYCWYDWCPTGTGRHRIQVRARSGNKWLKTQRACEVK